MSNWRIERVGINHAESLSYFSIALAPVRLTAEISAPVSTVNMLFIHTVSWWLIESNLESFDYKAIIQIILDCELNDSWANVSSNSSKQMSSSSNFDTRILVF